MTELRTIITLEQRLSSMESELRKATEQVRALSDWRRRTARGHFLTAACVTFLLLVFGWGVPAPAAPTTVAAPFTVQGRGGGRLVIDDNSLGSGLVMTFYNSAGNAVLEGGVNKDGQAGSLVAESPGGQQRVTLGLDEKHEPFIDFISANLNRAEIGWGAKAGGMGLAIFNANGEIASLGEKGGNGYLMLADAHLTTRLEAGTQTNGDGAVKVYGPTGKCGVALAGIPCMMVAR